MPFCTKFIVLLSVLAFGGTRCEATIVAYLTAAEGVSSDTFESNFFLQANQSRVGDSIEWINLDVFHSQVLGSPLAEFGRVEFEASAPFVDWQAGSQFGQDPEPSQMILDSFAAASPQPFQIVSEEAIHIGTFRFDYSGITLQTGDTITLDIFGRDDGTPGRTTSVAIRESGSSQTQLINPDFTSPLGSFQTTFGITAIPEPSSVGLLLFTAGCLFPRRRRSRK